MNTYMPNVGTAFLWSDAVGTIYLAVHFGAATNWGQLLFEGGIVYFVGKPADSNDGWIRYMWTI